MRPWQEPDGALLGYRGLDHEVSPRSVTAKKADEKALRDAHERLRTLIDARCPRGSG